MAGHSKFKNIMHRKGAQDAKRGKIFTKLIKEIVVAAKMGGGVLENNPSLRAVIDKALAANMKRDTIENAVKRGSGDLDGESYEEIRYEGYGLGGTAIMVDCLTDNKNRTVSDVRHAFTKHGGNLGTDGSVSYMFSKQGFISFDSGDEDTIMEIAIESGAEDIITNEDGSIDLGAEVLGLQNMAGEVLLGDPIPGANDAAETVDHSAIVGDSNLWDDLIVDRDGQIVTPSGNTQTETTTSTTTTTSTSSGSNDASNKDSDLVDGDEAKARSQIVTVTVEE